MIKLESLKIYTKDKCVSYSSLWSWALSNRSIKKSSFLQSLYLSCQLILEDKTPRKRAPGRKLQRNMNYIRKLLTSTYWTQPPNIEYRLLTSNSNNGTPRYDVNLQIKYLMDRFNVLGSTYLAFVEISKPHLKSCLQIVEIDTFVCGVILIPS